MTKPIYSTIIRAKGLFDGCETASEMIKALKGQIEYLEDLRAHGVELSGPVEDDYGFLETDNQKHAKIFGMDLEENTEE